MPTPVRVLLVEDNPTDAQLALFELERAGFDPIPTRAETETEILAAVAAGQDVVLCDWTLPQLDAMRVLELVRECDSEVPILIVSGFIGEETAVEAMKLGASDYLLKDRLGRLGSAVAQALEQRQLREAERRGAAALRVSEARLAGVMNSVLDAVITVDERGIIRWVNPATETLFGHAPSDLEGKPVSLLMPDSHARRHDDYIERYLRTGEARVIGKVLEVSGLRADGTTFPAELAVTEFWLEGTRYFTGVVRDLTNRRHLEAQVRQAQKMEAVGRLAGGVAHDFNNLLTVINGYCELLLADTPETSPARPGLDAIRDAAERAAGLTQQLLSFSRKAVVEPKVFGLNESVRRAEHLLRRLIGEDVDLIADLDERVGSIRADPGQIDQVIMNLVVNARDAMPTGGRLTLATRAVRVGPDEVAELSVQDTGTGMTPEVLARVFEPFFTTKGPGKGTGLGLAVAHGIVKQAGGQIDIETRVGAGTTFRMRFPTAVEKPTAARHEKAPERTSGRETILLAEDEQAVRRIARVSLEASGYTVLEAPDGDSALRLATAHPEPIHLLVTDVVMPGMSGPELATTLRALRPEIRVLFLSGYTDDVALLEGVAEGGEAFLQKPFTPLGFARKVRSVLD